MALRDDIGEVKRFIRELERRWPPGMTVIKTLEAIDLLKIADHLSDDVVGVLRSAREDAILKLAAGIGDGTLIAQSIRINDRLQANYRPRVQAAVRALQFEVDLGPFGDIPPIRAGYVVAMKDYEGILERLAEIQEAASEIPRLFAAIYRLAAAIIAFVVAAIKAILKLLTFVLELPEKVAPFIKPLLWGLGLGALVLVSATVYQRLQARRSLRLESRTGP